MKNIEITYTNLSPLKARASARLVEIACGFSSHISISIDNKILNAKSILGVLSMGAKQGDIFTISAVGDDEIAAAEAVAKFIETGFDE